MTVAPVVSEPIGLAQPRLQACRLVADAIQAVLWFSVMYFPRR